MKPESDQNSRILTSVIRYPSSAVLKGDYLHSPHYHNGNIPAVLQQQEQITRDMQTSTNCQQKLWTD